MSQEQRRALDEWLRAQPPLAEGSVAQRRAAFEELMAPHPLAPEVAVAPAALAGRPALAFTPPGPPRPGVLLYFHGGAFVLGSPATAAHLTTRLVRRTGLRALSLDYRLAPEHPLPAAIEDGVAAYRALLDAGEAPGQVVFAGDSAGGHLVVSTMLAARDAGLPLPAAGVAFSPGADASRSGVSMATKAGADPIFTPAALTALAELYLGGQDPAQPLLSPAVAADLTGLPPLLLQVGSNEVLLDDATRLAVRAAHAGVDVVLDVTGGVPHVFQSFAGQLDEADAALDRAGRFVTERLAVGDLERVL